MKYWQPKYETMNPEEMKSLQLKRLQQSLKLVYDNVPFYRQKFKEAVQRAEKDPDKKKHVNPMDLD